MKKTKNKDKYLGTFMGLALGDVLGAPYEGGPIERFAWYLLGTTRDEKRRYTDDTQMAINIAESFIKKGSIDQDHLAMAFAKSYRWSRGYGPSTSKLLTKIKKGGDWRKLNKQRFPKGSFGNGAAMRAPILALCFSDVEQVRKAIEQCSEITHPNELAIEGAKLIGLVAYSALNDIGTSEIIKSLPSWCKTDIYSKKIRICCDLLTQSTPADLKAIKKQLGNGIASYDSTVTALYFALFYRDENFNSMLKAIAELGGDTDTIGAMAGAIWGAFNGASKFDQEIICSIEDADKITNIAKQLFKFNE